jgi:hypothetical protein
MTSHPFVVYFTLVLLIFSSCKKFIDVEPPVTRITGESAFNSDATASAVLTGLYTDISGTTIASPNKFRFLSLYAGLSSDELTLWQGISDNLGVRYYRNSLVSSSALSIGGELWRSCYPYIFICNSAIEGLDKSTLLSPVVKQQLMGEAKFMRALFYFYLVNLYGDCPMPLTTDPGINSNLPRTSVSDIYLQIIADLKEAQNLLSSQYLDASLLKTTAERVRPTKWAATALLARVYLYKGDWANAELEASYVINNSSLYVIEPLNNVFKKNNKEAIWQMQPVRSGYNTEEAWVFIIPATGPTNFFTGNPVYMSSQLLNAFESGDQRKVNGNWVNSITVGANTFFYPYKYKVNTLNSPVTEYLTVLRLGEQYLIRAEARAKQNKISESQSDLNIIRTRAGLLNTTANDQPSLLSAILHERQVELFTEFGHRWLDLKRTGNINTVMSIVTPQKGGTWNSNWALYPIPFSELQAAPQLTQNNGY